MTKATEQLHKAPKHLREDSAPFFNTVLADYVLDDHHVILLTKACESLDRIAEGREIIKKDGLTYRDRFGSPRANPAVAIERDNKIAVARLFRRAGAPDRARRTPRRVFRDAA